MALALVVVFYYIFNHAIPALTHQGLYKPSHWLLTLLLVAGLGALLAYRVAMGAEAIRDPYMRYFIITNTLVAPLWFTLFSSAAKHLARFVAYALITAPREMLHCALHDDLFLFLY
uniref:Uncharacterized protein n=1 Tax=Tanacetum cinerariifolium TaxID=118510 RepID=A0A699UQD1_TANCI|nr:hypothetical protein [Tanacetum cinerariifolium]